MGETTIEWCDKVWNPVTGCSKVSAGCKNCYAERIFPRPYGKTCVCGCHEDDHVSTEGRSCITCLECEEGYRQRKFTDVVCHEDRLEQPLKWRKPQRVFVNSMSDLFHEDVPFEFIDKVFAVMALSARHTFQILTKRPARMLEYMNSARQDAGERRIAIEYAKEELQDSIPCGIPSGPWPLPNVWFRWATICGFENGTRQRGNTQAGK